MLISSHMTEKKPQKIQVENTKEISIYINHCSDKIPIDSHFRSTCIFLLPFVQMLKMIYNRSYFFSPTKILS